ncbi:MAG: transglutaminase-like domain-containing protein [Deltaproteobacteria bacterium]|nr:transglutaminase-like domain-containing protein [Deltaproteobacteria bacterium]
MKIGSNKDIFKPSLLKSTAVFLVFIFAWTNLGIYQVVYAATTNSGEHQVANSESKPSSSSFPRNRESSFPDKELEKALERIRETISKPSTSIPSPLSAGSTSAGIQPSPSVIPETSGIQTELKQERTELDKADVSIRQQFKQTEQRIKGLPAVIQQRQKAFERKYEKNYAQLKSELDSINTAKTNTQFTTRTRKLKAFLDKIKPPQRHIKFNPNKLPHRMVHPVRRLTFTKLESPDQAIAQSTAFSNGAGPAWREPRMNYNNQHRAAVEQKDDTEIGESEEVGQLPIQLASLTTDNLLSSALVQTIPPPTAADLTSTVEVQFTPAILAKAKELRYNAVNIYNWVYNNVEYVPTYGSIQGADLCLQTMQCNDMDTASLLIALLRASNIPARYVYGTIQLPINQIMNWVGGFTDAKSALELMAQGGIPITGEVAGGKIVAAKIEHAWVEAYVNYFPSRGARNGPGNEWIPLDASYKQYTYTQGMNITQAVPFDSQSFLNQITSTATINTQQGYVTNINVAYISQTIANYQAQVANYISQTNPNATVGDVIGKKQIIQQNFPYLLGTLQYQVLAKGWEASEVPDTLRYKISFQIINPQTLQTDINYTVSLAQIAGKRLTLSYVPAISADETVIESYIPTGSSITISSLPTSLPAYLINMVPQLIVDGQVVATGSSIGLGGSETLTMTFTYANQYADTSTTNLTAGEYYGIGIDAGGVSSQTVLNLKNALSAIQSKLQAQDFTGMTRDDILGNLLYTTAVSYYAEYDIMDQMQAKIMSVVIARVPSEAVFSVTMNVSYMFGVATSISPAGLKMDVQRNLELTEAVDGNSNNVVQYMLTSGQNSSLLESSVPEQLLSTPSNPVKGISAIKAIQTANDQGIPIYTVNQSNISTVLPQLQLPSDVIADIQNAVNAGKTVTVSKTQITYNGWTGVGYIIIDPSTGAGAYMISGGLGGAIIITSLVFIGLLVAIGLSGGILIPVIGALLISLLPLYYVFIRWLMISATTAEKICVLNIIKIIAEVAISINIGMTEIIPTQVEFLLRIMEAVSAGKDFTEACIQKS